MSSTSDTQSVDQMTRRLIDEFDQALRADPGIEPDSFLAAYPNAPADVLPSLEVLKLLALTGHQPSASPFLPPGMDGKFLGDFEIIREIGRGGMGIVYEARQKHLERTVALKVLPFLASTDGRSVNRFLNEVRLASQLEHPHIVPIYSFGQERGIYYYSMRLIQGHSLANWLNKNRGEPRNPEMIRAICQWITQAAEAVHHAHQEGILHRDLKPANLLVDHDGNLWVTDFGLACRPGEAGLTLTGDLVGTLRFMSPELLVGDRTPPEPISDVYSLGITLFELLADSPAFQEPNQNALIRRITTGEPPRLEKLAPGLPKPLLDIVEKAIAQEKPDRYPSAKALAEDLTRFCAGQPIEARPATLWRRLQRWFWRHRRLTTFMGIAMGFGVATGLALSFAWIWQAYKAEKTSRLAMEAREKATLQVLQDMQILSERVVVHSPELWERHRDSLVHMVENLCAIADEPEASRQLRLQAAKGLLHLGDILSYRGDKDTSREQFSKAVSRLKELEKDYPQDQEIEFQLARAIRSKGPEIHVPNPRIAIEEFTREVEKRFADLVAKNPDKVIYLNSWSETCLGQGVLLFEEGDYSQAIPWLEKSDQINCKLRDMYPEASQHPLSYIRLGNTLQYLAKAYEKAGKYQEAEKTARRAVAANDVLARDQPNPVRDRETTCTASSLLGILLGSLGRYAEAEEYLIQGMTDTKDLAGLHTPKDLITLARIQNVYTHAAIQRLLGKKEDSNSLQEVRQHCQKISYPIPKLEEKIYSLILYPNRSKQPLEEVEALRKLLVAPTPGSDLAMGLSLIRQGAFESAGKYLEGDIQSGNPWSELATVYLAWVRHRTGHEAEARNVLANLLQKYPQNVGLNPITRLALKEVEQELKKPPKPQLSKP